MLSSPEYAGSTPDTHLVSHFQLRSNLWRKWLGGSNQGTAWVSPLGLAIDRLEAHPSETVLLNCTEGNASATVVLGLLPEGQGVQFLATHTCSTGGEQIRPWIEDLLSIEELRIEDIQCWGLHVDDLALASDLAKELKLQSYQMRATEFIRQQFGNCATATPFLLLEEILKKDRPQRGDYGVLVSYGSGGVFQGILVRF